ncbi:MAG: MCE family protein, partial [Candidatus Saccharibacteria bacterium]|nr:MCE family protein [Pseudorhodobacter sp.]
METRASFVLIGAFTLLAIFAGMGFFLWMAQVEINKSYTQYDILFDQASGLNLASPVKFNGVDVGKVLNIALDRDEQSKVRVRIEVSANTPIRQGTEATLSSQGVTGVGFVGLEGGTTDDPRLPVDPLTGVAQIPSKNTAVQSLIEDAPDLLKQANAVLANIEKFTSDENAAHVAQILANLDTSSGQVSKLMDDLSTASNSLSGAAENFASFSDRLDSVATNADGAITDARTALTSATK